MYSFKETDEQKVYFTSDTHFGHDRAFIYELRGFKNVVEHTDSIINNINAIVNENDILIHIGDLCLNTPPPKFEELLSRIKCNNIYMLWGNHPNPHYKGVYQPLVKNILKENYTPESEIYPLRYRNIVFIGHYAEITVNGQYMILSHYPISVWNEVRHGSWCLCGHSHHGYDLTQVDCITNGKILDVGVDGHDCKPWSFNELKSVMDKKQFVVKDHH